MTEPTEDDILQRAKELARMDGNAWDDEEGRGEQAEGEVAVITDESERIEYLNRAKRQLLREAQD
jgi:hypothetical protein